MAPTRNIALLVFALLAVACGPHRIGGPGVPTMPAPSPTLVNSTPTGPPAGVDVSDAKMVSNMSGWALTANGLFWSNDAGASWTSITPSNVTADEPETKPPGKFT